MITKFYSDITDGKILFLLPAVSVCVMYGLGVLFKWLLSKSRAVIDLEIIDTATQNAMSGAYVVLGFVLVLAMTTVTDLDNNVSQEATAIKSLERLLVLDGSAPALESRAKLIKYTKSIIDDEWPVLVEGHGSPVTSLALNDFYMSLSSIAPRDDKDEIVFSKVLELSDRVAELRNTRNYSIESNLPDTFYLVSILAIAGAVVICALRLVKASVTGGIVLAIQVALLTLMFSAILIVDLPYLGDTATSFEPISKAMESMVARKSGT